MQQERGESQGDSGVQEWKEGRDTGVHLWAAGKEAAMREVWAVREDRGVEGRGRRGPLACGGWAFDRG